MKALAALALAALTTLTLAPATQATEPASQPAQTLAQAPITATQEVPQERPAIASVAAPQKPSETPSQAPSVEAPKTAPSQPTAQPAPAQKPVQQPAQRAGDPTACQEDDACWNSDKMGNGLTAKDVLTGVKYQEDAILTAHKFFYPKVAAKTVEQTSIEMRQNWKTIYVGSYSKAPNKVAAGFTVVKSANLPNTFHLIRSTF